MHAMSSTIERKIATKMTSLGVPSSVKFYNHNKRDYDKHHLGSNEHDCISCSKHFDGVIPNNKQCKAICGLPLPTLKVVKVKNTNKVTKEEIREILVMSKLIQQTEQQ